MKYYSLATLLVWLFTASTAMADKVDVDIDDDGLIEINSLHELNRMRYHPRGTHYNESDEGCPEGGCFGFELTQDLDFDSDGDGDLSDEDFWNGGLGWEPIANFYGVFEGNGHTIRNLMINRPEEINVGLFNNLHGEVRNLRLTGDLMSIRAAGTVGALAGKTSSAIVSNVTSSGVVSGRIAIGGLIGIGLYEDKILNCSTTGNVFVDNDIPERPQTAPTEGRAVGGLIGEARTGYIEGSFASGNISGGRHVGGLVGSVYGTEVTASFASGTVEGNVQVGGLVGRLTPTYWGGRIVPARIIASYATGRVTGPNGVGSLLGSMETLPMASLDDLRPDEPTPEDIAALIPQVRQSYATGTVVLNGVQTAVLVGYPDGSIESSHWALDPSGTVLPELFPGLGGSGASLAQLSCPTSANNTTCADTVLYEGWDLAVDSAGQRIWKFGSPTDLPFIPLENHPVWINTDGPSGEGDHETISRIQSRHPYYPCLQDPDAVLEAHIPGHALIYRADYPATLEFFNIHEGLGCAKSQQPNGECPDFEVSYLCKGSWTAYEDRDNPSGEGDYERAGKSTVRCANPTEIRARVKGQTQVYYGTPDKLALFSAAEGLQCLKSDQLALGSSGCQNYNVRLSCPRRSFH